MRPENDKKDMMKGPNYDTNDQFQQSCVQEVFN